MATHASDRFAVSAEARRLHESAFVFDGLSIYYVLEERYTQRLLEGGVHATNVTVLWEQGWEESLNRIESALTTIAKNPLLKLGLNTADALKAREEGKLAVFLGTQGSIMVESHLYRLSLLCQMGVRFFGLTYSGVTLFGDGCAERRNAGLSFLGEELIDHANGLPLVLDLSHCGHATRREAVKLARCPSNTHSNAFAITPNPRNTEDDTLVEIARKSGVNGVVFHPKFVREGPVTLDDVLDHIDHTVRLLGVDHVAFGSDYLDGIIDARIQPNPRWQRLRPDMFAGADKYFDIVYPRGLESIRDLRNLTQGLLDRGYDAASIRKILGGNWLRVVEEAAHPIRSP